MRNFKVLVIDKCQDCKHNNCPLRTLCGDITSQCPLWSVEEATSRTHQVFTTEDYLEWKRYANLEMG